MKTTKYALALLGVLVFTGVTNARADSITYEISGVASGQIGATTFSNAEVNLIASADTANVVSFIASGTILGITNPTIFANPFSDFTATIAGIGTATITDPSTLWAVPSADVVLMGRIDAGHPGLTSITGIGLIESNTLDGYDGTTGIGPITDVGAVGFEVGCNTPGHDPCLSTTLGFLSFTSNLNPPTQATFTATVPEPSSLLLLGSGLLALMGMGLYKKRLA